MNKKCFVAQLEWIRKSYPSIRIIDNIPLRANSCDPIERHNFATIREADIVRYWLYLDLLPSANDRKVQMWFTQYLKTDFQQYQNCLDIVYELTRRDVIQTLSVSQFKAAVLKDSGISANLLLGPIWPEVEGLLLSTESKEGPLNYDLVKRVLQWTRLNSRMSLDNPSKEEACQIKFQENQDRLARIWSEPDSRRDEIVRRMKAIISKWINDKAFRPLPGRHGSGAVAEIDSRRLARYKTLHLGESDQLLDWFCRKYDVDPLTDLADYQVPTGELKRVSRWLTVPKSIEKRRGIAPQPAKLMWLQQGVLDGMYQQFWSQPFFRDHFPIFDRTVNQRAARKGSLYNHWSTYDLSDASDSVTVHLVKAVFGSNVRNCLICCRCTCTSAHPMMQTYGTMGDATVFPTETIVIGAAVALALIEAREHGDDEVNLRQFLVFGDDICVQNRSSVHHYIHDIFSHLGFKINDDKSFLDGRYRESCGVECYLGVDVHPWYLFNRASLPALRANRFASLIGAANNCYVRGLRLCRMYFLHELSGICHGYRLIPFTTDPTDSSKVWTSEYTDRTTERYNRQLQSLQYCYWTVAARIKDDDKLEDLEQWYRYYLYLLCPPPRVPEDLVQDDHRRSFLNRNLQMKKVWAERP